MDPTLIPQFIAPLVDGSADYTKGNRFYYLDRLASMPAIRIFGNGALSFLSKLSTGYWDIFDPTNGYVAIRAEVFENIRTEKINRRFFFESDVLFHLALIRAKVIDIPMHAVYGDEQSNLRIARAVPGLLWRHGRNFLKRIGYNYFLRDFSIASIYLALSIPMILFGSIFGLWNWWLSADVGTVASAGTVMLAALPLMLGVQFLLSFLNYDMRQIPREPIWPRLQNRRRVSDRRKAEES
jgi:hypothetical protein